MSRLITGFTHLFVPHPGNDHRPHVLRTYGLAVLLLLAAIFEGVTISQTAPVASRSGFLSEILSSVLVNQTNGHRAAGSIGVLRENPLLVAAAAAKAQDMAEKGYFAHVSPEGITPWYWLEQKGYRYSYAGENLAVNFVDSRDVTEAWMASPGHRANILNHNFTEIGIATARGVFNGEEAVYVVEMFGTPAPVPTAETLAGSTPIAAAPTIVPMPAKTNIVTATATSAPPEAIEDSFVAAVNAPEDAGPLPPSGDNYSRNPVMEFLARPSVAASYLALIFSLLIGITLISKLTRVGMLHPRLVTEGFLVLLVMASIVVVNHYVIIAEAAIR